MRAAFQLTFAIFILMSSQAFAADKPDAKAQGEMMQKFVAASTPGAPHRRLDEMVGDYTTMAKSWMSADAKPEEVKGHATLKMILGGRWLEQTMSAEASGHMPAFEGMGLIGYDNVKKEYVSVWLDTMSTGAMIGNGEFDSKTKTLADAGKYSCPMTGKDRGYRSTWQMKEKNTMVFALYGTPPMEPTGKEFKMMEVTYKRK